MPLLNYTIPVRASAAASTSTIAAPVGEVHFDGRPAAEVVDDWLEGHRQRAVGAREILFPVAAAEGDRAKQHAVLHEPQGEVAAGGADALGWLGQANVGRAQNGSVVAVTERSEAFDLLHRLMSER